MPDVGEELEAAVSEAGMLAVWAEKYRHADPRGIDDARRRLLRLGDLARRLGREGALDSPAAQELLAQVRQVCSDLQHAIRALRTAADYRQAVSAAAGNDAAALLTWWPMIFAGVRAAPPPAAAFWTPTWQRRGRPLSPDPFVAALTSLADAGVPAAADDLMPGVDPELPGVLLSTAAPFGAPLALRYDAHVLPATTLWLGEDQLVLPGRHLRLRFVVALAADGEPLDEWVADPAAYLRRLEDACRRAGFPVTRMPTPAASS